LLLGVHPAVLLKGSRCNGSKVDSGTQWLTQMYLGASCHDYQGGVGVEGSVFQAAVDLVLLFAVMRVVQEQVGCRLWQIHLLGVICISCNQQEFGWDVVQHAPPVGRIMCMHVCLAGVVLLSACACQQSDLRVQYVCSLCCDAPV
jgi:hypothetical protein